MTMNEFPIIGIHHVTAMTSSAEKIYHFFTEILGLRLIKKTVNQDDIQTYHLYFTDDVGTPGTDMTFFDFPGAPKGKNGTDSIAATSFRVPSNASLLYWQERLSQFQIEHEDITELFGKKVLPFVDFDGQNYQLISDENNAGIPGGLPWKNAPVPAEHAITGLGQILVNVNHPRTLIEVLVDTLGFKEVLTVDHSTLLEVGAGGNGGAIIVNYQPDLPLAQEGYGQVHHVAWRVKDDVSLKNWIFRLENLAYPSSGFVDRFYFQSEYFKPTRGILFELATDGPGFLVDEPYETAGEILSLPPFLEKKRTEIEGYVRPFDTTKHNLPQGKE